MNYSEEFYVLADDDKKIQTKSSISLADDINKLLVATFNRDNTFLGEESRKGNAHPEFKGDFDRFRDARPQFVRVWRLRVERADINGEF